MTPQQHRLRLPILVLFIALTTTTFSGCVVVSINPWLDADKAIMTPSLAGIWTNTNKAQTASFVSDSIRYEWTLTVGTNNDTEKYECDLHAIGDTLLLQIYSSSERAPSTGTLLPVYHLFRLQLTNDTMLLYPMDRSSFVKRARRSGLIMAEPEKKRTNKEKDFQSSDPVIVGSMTETLEKFVAKHIKDKAFFSSDPWYSFTRVQSNMVPDAQSTPQDSGGSDHETGDVPKRD